MDTPSADDCHRQVAPGWTAYDLTPQDVTPVIPRFISKFTPGRPDECWLWTGRTFRDTGYGVISRSSRLERGQHLLAHRVAWVAFTGKALTGNLTIDHLCNNKVCVNPAHLEPVTLHENIRRKNERLGNTIGGKKKVRSKAKAPCPNCGKPRRKDTLRQHIARMHPEAA